MYTNYKYAIRQSDGFTASFETLNDALAWFKLGSAEYASVTKTTHKGNLIHLAEFERKDGTVTVWKATEWWNNCETFIE